MVDILLPVKKNDDSCKEFLDSYVRAGFELEGLKVLEDVEEGESFAHKVNRGILETKCDIVILHNDMIVNSIWWFTLLVYVNDIKAGIYGSKLVFPNGIVRHFGGHINCKGEGVHPERGLLDMGQFSECKEVPFVTFGGCYIKREVINKVGYLDEAIKPWGYEDMDYGLRAIKEGFRIVCTPAVLVHKESQVAKTLPDLEGILKRNKEYVMRKHGLKVFEGVPEWI